MYFFDNKNNSLYKDDDTTGEEYPTEAERMDILSNLITSYSRHSRKNCAKFNP